MNEAWQRIKNAFSGEILGGGRPVALPLPTVLGKAMGEAGKQAFMEQQKTLVTSTSIIVSPGDLRQIFDAVLDPIIDAARDFQKASKSSIIYLTGGLAANKYYQKEMTTAFPPSPTLKTTHRQRSPNLAVGK